MQLKDYINVIRKRWWLALITAVVAAAVAFGYSSTQTKMYESKVQLIGTVGKPDSGLYNSVQQQLQSYTSRFTSTDLANQINQIGKFDLSASDIINKIHVQARPTDYIFEITVQDTSPERAKSIADVAADILVNENLSQNEGLNPDQQVYVNKNAPAGLPDKPYSPRTLLLTGAGAGLGLILGLILMFVVEFLDDTLKDESDIQRYVSLSTLGQIPRWKTQGGSGYTPSPALNRTERASNQQEKIKNKT